MGAGDNLKYNVSYVCWIWTKNEIENLYDISKKERNTQNKF